MSRQVSIHSDGTSVGTAILDSDGNKLAHVGHASIEIDARDGVSVTLEVGASAVNIQGTVASSHFECQLCSKSFDHECDTRLGGGPGEFLPNDTSGMFICGSSIAEKDPWIKHDCIRQQGHDKKHFDGEVAWND